ncbi:MAG: cytochrome c5 family protein, partial [Betaproteobacteria bacterium]|nr:cytochrome c5 family protein [Betaproteobacteria bacterium]
MSDNHEEAHTGPIQTPKAFAWLVFLSFVGPVFIIIGLVNYVVSGNKPAAGASNPAESVASRIEKVGAVQVKDANRPLKTGEEVFKAQCSACHAAGLAGSPKFGDTAAWAPRIKSGYEALLNSALKGKNAMGAQGGGD